MLRLTRLPIKSSAFNNFCHTLTRDTIILENLKQFGILCVQCRKSNVEIKNLDPHIHQDGDKAFINFNSINKNFDPRQYFKWNYDTNSSKLTLSEITTSKDEIHVKVEVPHNFDIDVSANNVLISETEGKTVNVKAFGDCELGKIKSFDTIFNVNGSLKCKSLQGNGKMEVRGNIDMGKLQSSEFSILINNSNIKISNIYSKTFTCTANNGDITFGSLHGNGKLALNNGDINISSMSGDLDASVDNGNISVTFNSFLTSIISSNNGDINVGFGDLVSTYVTAEASHIDIPETLLFDGVKRTSDSQQFFEGKLLDGKADLSITSANGNISLSRKEWLSNFKMDFLD